MDRYAGDGAHAMRVPNAQSTRPKASREYGQDMNLPFLKRGFHKYILNLRKESDESYLIRTGSSYLFFVRISGGDWKLYRYGDKPIE